MPFDCKRQIQNGLRRVAPMDMMARGRYAVGSGSPVTANLEAWYDASQETAGANVLFTDRSGNGRNAAGTGTVTAAQQNGLSGMVMNGSSNVFTATLGTPTVRTVSLVAFNNASAVAAFPLNIGVTSDGIAMAAAGQWQFRAPNTNYGTSATTPRVLTFVISATNVDLYYDGSAVNLGLTATDANGITASLFIGAKTAIAGFFTGNIYELRIWSVGLTKEQIFSDCKYLKNKWALP